MRDMIENSALFSGSACTIVPNCIDLALFSPGNKADARKKWNIPEDAKVILFGAQDADQPLKGMKYLVESLNKLKSKNNIILLVYGKCKSTMLTIAGLPVIHCGIIKKENEMAELYRAANVFVCPSVIDNFPNTILEATACGVPSVAFRTGGIPEMILHQKTGYLCDAYDTDDMAKGIEYCLLKSDNLRYETEKFAQSQYNPHFVSVPNTWHI
jgi:glycosyltransferase involved in cell wall biosynthesis